MHQTPIFGKPDYNSLGGIIGSFKAAVTRRINKINKHKTIIWQQNYYDYIIRNNKNLYNIRKYIKNNPLKWEMDKYHK